MDLKSYSRWYDYSRARDAMFAATDTAYAPWYVAPLRRQEARRLNIITHLLEPFRTTERRARRSSCPSVRRPRATEPDYPYKFVPEKF